MQQMAKISELSRGVAKKKNKKRKRGGKKRKRDDYVSLCQAVPWQKREKGEIKGEIKSDDYLNLEIAP